MRITNQIRDAFIKAAMSDVPQVNYQAQAEELAKDWIASQMAAIFPGVDLEKARPWLEETSVYMPGELHSFYGFAPNYNYLKSNPELWSKLEGLNRRLEAQRAHRNKLQDQLHGCAYGVSTVKALAELLPEFAHYLPDETTPARMLPATTGVVAAFHAAGWPKKSRAAALEHLAHHIG